MNLKTVAAEEVGVEITTLFAETVGVPFNTLLNYRTVSKAYEKSHRRENLSWTHHQVLAARPDRLEWLARAEAQALSSKATLPASTTL